jgi:hypothetical protein
VGRIARVCAAPAALSAPYRNTMSLGIGSACHRNTSVRTLAHVSRRCFSVLTMDHRRSTIASSSIVYGPSSSEPATTIRSAVLVRPAAHWACAKCTRCVDRESLGQRSWHARSAATARKEMAAVSATAGMRPPLCLASPSAAIAHLMGRHLQWRRVYAGQQHPQHKYRRQNRGRHHQHRQYHRGGQPAA